MNWRLFRWAADCGLRVADRAGILERIHPHSSPIVLMYHGILRRKPSAIGIEAVDREGFARQMRYLKQHFRVVHPNDFEHEVQSVSSNGKPAIVLTFDDGFANNLTIAAPILEELRLPALFFVSTRHLEPGRYLWFIHARALFKLWPGNDVRLLGRTWKLGLPAARDQALWAFMHRTRAASIAEIYWNLLKYPVEIFVPPDVIEDELRGLTEAEVAAITRSGLMTIGAHTCNHPYLTACTTNQVVAETTVAKATLERICGRAITMFAYPAGDYNVGVASVVKQAGFTLAFASTPHTQVTDARMAVPRVGIYRAGLGILAGKSHGMFGHRNSTIAVSTLIGPRLSRKSLAATSTINGAHASEARSTTNA